ncbi:hypothetical protein, partial [Nisaea sp.]|uniref:hypothetical protein n=1 Tax=Nisaea sp. TaxID=2024842 RepID=UPI0025DE6D35
MDSTIAGRKVPVPVLRFEAASSRPPRQFSSSISGDVGDAESNVSILTEIYPETGTKRHQKVTEKQSLRYGTHLDRRRGAERVADGIGGAGNT